MEDSGHTPEWTRPKVERTLSNGNRIYIAAFKTWMVEQARKPDISVAGLALRHGVNANLLRHWMKLGHWQGQPHALLPVTIVAEPTGREPAAATRAYPSSGTMEIELCGAVVRLSGEIDAAQLKTVLAVLRS